MVAVQQRTVAAPEWRPRAGCGGLLGLTAPATTVLLRLLHAGQELDLCQWQMLVSEAWGLPALGGARPARAHRIQQRQQQLVRAGVQAQRLLQDGDLLFRHRAVAATACRS